MVCLHSKSELKGKTFSNCIRPHSELPLRRAMSWTGKEGAASDGGAGVLCGLKRDAIAGRCHDALSVSCLLKFRPLYNWDLYHSLFRCCEKAPWAKQFIQGGVYLGLRFQRAKCSSWWGGRAVAGMVGGTGYPELTPSNTSMKQSELEGSLNSWCLSSVTSSSKATPLPNGPKQLGTSCSNTWIYRDHFHSNHDIMMQIWDGSKDLFLPVKKVIGCHF